MSYCKYSKEEQTCHHYRQIWNWQCGVVLEVINATLPGRKTACSCGRKDVCSRDMQTEKAHPTKACAKQRLQLIAFRGLLGT